MKNLFGEKKEPEQQARDAIRHKKWAVAIAFYEKKIQDNERDFALWNLLGDLHINNKSRAQALESWRRALEGYALEGLHENVLGIAGKILRRTPDEDEVYLLLAEAYLGLEYYADCLTAFRSYLKLSKRRSEPDMRSLVKKIADSQIRHLHLLEELSSIYKDAAIEDIELERRLEAMLESARQASRLTAPAEPVSEREAEEEEYGQGLVAHSAPRHEEGLIGLDGLDSFSEDTGGEIHHFSRVADAPQSTPMDFGSNFETPAVADASEIPAGEGKDHYDLGMVYKEMKLWDASIAEFQQARRDPSVRLRATLPLAECLQETHDLQGALDLLESELQASENSPQEKLGVVFQMGVIHELLGNLDEALSHFERVHSENASYGDVELRVADLRSRLDGDPPPD
jgi:tetratricopeptide (TPR) repeat protein